MKIRHGGASKESISISVQIRHEIDGAREEPDQEEAHKK
jgi:hypothetical protein